MFHGQREQKKTLFFKYCYQTSELLCQGYIVHWCYAINIQLKEEKAEDIPIVCELREVFRQEKFIMRLNSSLVSNLSQKAHIV